jgi:hypothetical protein
VWGCHWKIFRFGARRRRRRRTLGDDEAGEWEEDKDAKSRKWMKRHKREYRTMRGRMVRIEKDGKHRRPRVRRWEKEEHA